MGRLNQLITGEPEAVYKLDFGDRVTNTIAEVVAQEAVNRLVPAINAIEVQARESGERLEAGAEQAAKTLNEAIGDAVAAELVSLKQDLQKAIKSLSQSSSKDATTIREGLIKALGRVRIPDYSDQLSRIESAQPALMQAISEALNADESPTEWMFTVNRNGNGFIQSVTAKAK